MLLPGNFLKKVTGINVQGKCVKNMMFSVNVIVSYKVWWGPHSLHVIHINRSCTRTCEMKHNSEVKGDSNDPAAIKIYFDHC